MLFNFNGLMFYEKYLILGIFCDFKIDFIYGVFMFVQVAGFSLLFNFANEFL